MVSIQLISPASEENSHLYKPVTNPWEVSIQLISPASEENLPMLERIHTVEPALVSIQLISPASEEINTEGTKG